MQLTHVTGFLGKFRLAEFALVVARLKLW